MPAMTVTGSTFTGSRATVSLPTSAALALLEEHTGVVIPVYFRPDADPAVARATLHDTVMLFVRELRSPRSICLSVDGSLLAEQVAREAAATFGVRLVVSPENRGKLAALAAGVTALLENPNLRYLAMVDADGDHFANELLNFVRAAEHVAEATGNDRLLALGNRSSRYRPLGLLRAEGEELANRMLMDALVYDAVAAGKPLMLQFLTAYDPLPDFHSGYKCFSRRSAEQVFTAPPALAGCTPDAYYRHAIEAVMVVEAHKGGATLLAVNRRTFDEQPISSFASINRIRLAADLILWPCKRLGVPGPFVAQWLDNHLPALLLGALVPQGRDELLAIRDQVRAEYGLPPGPPDIIRPDFV
ncbi:MAG TPA: glycosyltransferase [Caldilineaceae bacterium]|nr:glycosyltransferase [Caldilineaceae bacterium]